MPPIAIRPFTVFAGDAGLAREIEGIMARDLRYSDRFQVRDSLPAEFAGEGVQYALWEQFAVDWLEAGAIEPAGTGGELAFAVEVHDIVFGSPQGEGHPFRSRRGTTRTSGWAVHSVSDAVVEWVTGDRGVAATRIVFRMLAFGSRTAKEIYIVDFDGENLRRLTWDDDIATSPVWSPDGKRIAYSSFKAGSPRIYELNLEDGQDRLLVPEGHGQHDMPSYHPDGHSIAFTIIGHAPAGLFTYNIRDGCCLKYLGGGRYNDPAAGLFRGWRAADLRVQPPGQRDAAGIHATLGSAAMPYSCRRSATARAGYFTDPDWSPCGDKAVFAGGIGSRRQANRFHILVADIEGGGNRVLQLTQEGNNEDPSWAPNCRHIVLSGGTQLRVRGVHRRLGDGSHPPPGAQCRCGRSGLVPRAGRRRGSGPSTGISKFAYILIVSSPGSSADNTYLHLRGRRDVQTHGWSLPPSPLSFSPPHAARNRLRRLLPNPPAPRRNRTKRSGLPTRLPRRRLRKPPGWRPKDKPSSRWTAGLERPARPSSAWSSSTTTNPSSPPQQPQRCARKLAILRSCSGVHLRMEGHADERGTSEYNITLGSERAMSVSEFFTGFGLDDTRFTTLSYGEESPIAQGSNEAAWARNRRVEFVITAGGNDLGSCQG